MRRLLIPLALLLVFSSVQDLFGEWHLRLKPVMGWRAMDADDLKDDFETSSIFWMNFVQKPLSIQSRFGNAMEFGAEASLPILPFMSASATFIYFGEEAKAQDSSTLLCYDGTKPVPLYYYVPATTSYKSRYYVLGLMGGANFYSYSVLVPELAYYLRLGGGIATLHLKREESYNLNFSSTVKDYSSWAGSYNDVGYLGEITLGVEYNIKKWAFAWLECGYNYMTFGKLTGDERWDAGDVTVVGLVQPDNPTFTHQPPSDHTLGYPYSGTFEKEDIEALKPDGKPLTVVLSGYILRLGVGVYLF